MTRPPYHRVNPTRPRPGRVPRQRSTPPPTPTSGKGTSGGLGCPMAIPALPLLLIFALFRRNVTTEEPRPREAGEQPEAVAA